MSRSDRTNGDRDEDRDDGELDELVAAALVRRGALVPTTSAEVEAAEEEDVAFEGDLPASLAQYRPPAESEVPVRSAARVVSLDEARRARGKATARYFGHVATFALGAAAAAAFFLAPAKPGTPGETGVPEDQGDGPATPPKTPVASIDPIGTCSDGCCAGASCSAAQGELRACGSGRSCVACDDALDKGTSYRVRLGHLYPEKALSTDQIEIVDLCARVASSRWDCAPAYADPADNPPWRRLPMLATTEDAGGGIELELRIRGTKQVLGRWHESVRVSSNVLCRGVGVSLEDPEGKSLGRLSLFFDDAHYVELGRGGLDALATRRAELAFSDVTPQIVETNRGGADRFALVVGPLDEPRAEKLRWSLLDRGLDARVELGADYTGEPRPLP